MRQPSAVATFAGMAERRTPQAFLEHLTDRDFERLAATLAAGAVARLLLPRGLEEHSGREAIAARFQNWFGSAAAFDLLASSEQPLGTRHRLSWRFSVMREGHKREVVEQVAYLDFGSGGIERIDLLCSGFQGETGAGGPKQSFDAGAMGCGDGLAQEFRRRIALVPMGGSLEVVVNDPAAKEDLPSLARLLGHRVASTEAQEDGRLTITVERLK